MNKMLNEFLEKVILGNITFCLVRKSDKFCAKGL